MDQFAEMNKSTSDSAAGGSSEFAIDVDADAQSRASTSSAAVQPMATASADSVSHNSESQSSDYHTSGTKVVVLEVRSANGKNKLAEILQSYAPAHSTSVNSMDNASQSMNTTRTENNTRDSANMTSDGSVTNTGSSVTGNLPTFAASFTGASAETVFGSTALSSHDASLDVAPTLRLRPNTSTSANRVHDAFVRGRQTVSRARMNIGASGHLEGTYSRAQSSVSPTPVIRRVSHVAQSFAQGSSSAGTTVTGTNSVSRDRPLWARQNHRGASVAAESSRDAQARRARQAAGSDTKRVITNADYEYSDDESESEKGAVSQKRLPTYERAIASSIPSAESSREAEARKARQDAGSDTNRVVTDADYEDSNGEDSDVELLFDRPASPKGLPEGSPQDLSKRSKEDARRPILEAKGVVCAHDAACDTRSPFRRCISAFFGRNKACGRDIPDNVWLHICRKHYQRCRYRDIHLWAQRQCAMIAEQFDRIEEWSEGNRAARYGGYVAYWTVILRRREAERRKDQAAKKKSKAKAAQAKGRGKGKGKAPAAPAEDEEDEYYIKGESGDDDDASVSSADDLSGIWATPDWLAALQGQHLSFDDIRRHFARLRQAVCSVPNRQIPEIEFLPVLRWLGGAEPAKVTYTRRKPKKEDGSKSPPSNRLKSDAKGKSKANAIKVESESEEDNNHTMADAHEYGYGSKRKREDTEDEYQEAYQRRPRHGPVPARRNSIESAMRTLNEHGFEIRAPQSTPSQRHMYVQQPHTPLPARARYIPRHEREREAYTPPVFNSQGTGMRPSDNSSAQRRQTCDKKPAKDGQGSDKKQSKD